MSEAFTTIQVSEDVTEVSIAETGKVEIAINEDTTTVEINNLAVPTAFVAAADVAFTPHGTVTATNLNEAIQQLADQQFRGTTAPTSDNANLEEGDLFYDTDDNQIKVYRETSSGVFEFVPIIVGDASGDSDTLDAGAF